MWTPPHNYNTGQQFISNVNIANLTEGKKQEQQLTPIEHFFPMQIERKDKPAMWKRTQNERKCNPCHFNQWQRNDQPYCSREPFRHQYFTGHPNYFPVYNQTRESEQSEPLSNIEWIHRTVNELVDQVEKFNGQPKDKEYLFLNEMLTRSLLELDSIDTDGKESIRHARKEAISCIQKGISTLESKALANQRCGIMMKIDKSTVTDEKLSLKSLEVSGVSRSGSQCTSSSHPLEVDDKSLIKLTNFDGPSIAPSGSESICSQSVKVIYKTSTQNNTSEEITLVDEDTEVDENQAKTEDTLREQSEDSVTGEAKDADQKVWKRMMCLFKRHLKL